MTLYDLISPPDRYPRQVPVMGVVPAIVTNNEDPDGLGRVRLKFPWLNDDAESHWARIATPMAGADRGFFMLPEMGDEVLVGFEHADPRRPVVLGALWNGKDGPPGENSNGENNLRFIKSRSGHTILLDDTDGGEQIVITDKDEKNFIRINVAEGNLEITADADITISAPNGTLKLECKDLELTASSSAKLTSGGDGDIEATGTLNIQGSTVNIN